MSTKQETITQTDTDNFFGQARFRRVRLLKGYGCHEAGVHTIATDHRVMCTGCRVKHFPSCACEACTA